MKAPLFPGAAALMALVLNLLVLSPAAAQDSKGLPVTITSDRMEGDLAGGRITFLDHVKVVRGEMVLRADRVDVFPKEGGQAIERIQAQGNVRVTAGPRTSVSDRAEYWDAEALLLLVGNARLSDGKRTLTGPLIRVYLDQDRAEVEGDTVERPTFLFEPAPAETPTEGE